jgi:hypothetical protein
MPSATRNAFVAVVVAATAMLVATRTTPGLVDNCDPFWSMRGACSGALACRNANGHKRGIDLLNQGATTLHTSIRTLRHIVLYCSDEKCAKAR